MIKITYEHLCDGCNAPLNTETYDCSNYPHLEFPRPHRRFSFDWTGLNVMLCKDCAQPMYDAKDQMLEKIRARRK